MQIPKQLIIKGQKIVVEHMPEIPYNDGKCAGYCDDAGDLTITIENHENSTKEEVLATLLHEINHAIIASYFINQGIDSGLEEVICESFAQEYVNILPKLKKLIK